jgi:transcriptional accessory protein Tex/SPT6
VSSRTSPRSARSWTWGVHQHGLVHVSERANRFVRDPAEVVEVGDWIRVKVRKIDTERRRIGRFLKQATAVGEGSKS